jgi:hypothetical protein
MPRESSESHFGIGDQHFGLFSGFFVRDLAFFDPAYLATLAPSPFTF